ncbi:FAD-binding oxidoreductase [Candidatus Woesearchaeota archaeon]|nr:FAD-binding oxidoreductase [Candidatus Woesearchaeota archaeon]
MKEKIEDIVGAGNVSDKEQDLLVYQRDSSGLEGHPRLVAWPATTDEIARIMKLANLRSFPVVVRGSGTSVAGGTLADDVLILDLSRMNKVLRLNMTEHSVTVQPAVTVRQVNTLLSSYDVHFPIIPHTFAGVSTIGGIVSRNMPSPVPRYGRAGDWVMSLEVVDGTGKVFNPSKVPLFIGSEGILGVITQLTVKLVKPIASLSGSWKEGTPEELLSLLGELKVDQDVVTVEFFDAYCSQLLGLGDKPHLWVEYVFLDKGDIKEQQELYAVQSRLARLFSLLKQNKQTIHTDPFVPVEGMAEFLRFCRKNELPVYGHLAAGIMHACIRKEHPEYAKRIYKLAQKLHGYPSGECGIGRAWKEYLPHAAKEELTASKKFYDPSGIMNPGCLL